MAKPVVGPMTESRYRKLKKKGRIPSGHLSAGKRKTYLQGPPNSARKTPAPRFVRYTCPWCGLGESSRMGNQTCPRCGRYEFFG